MSLLGNIWRVKNQDNTKSVLTKLYENRGLTQEKEKHTFLTSDPESQIHDPFLMEDMPQACERIFQAIERNERIVVFGDYDADGVTATAVLVRTLKKLGAEVSYRIPHRIKDGYSLKNYFLDELADIGVKLVITVDNGIAAAREIAYAYELGMEIIITDHHTPPPRDQLPRAVATLNPQLEGCPYPYKELSGSAVALKFCEALCAAKLKNDPNREVFLDTLYQIASIGIVADCMPLTGENRAIVKIGLESIKWRPIRGIEELLKVAGVEREKVTARSIGFVIGPRINAAGRLESAYEALHLFLNMSEGVVQIAQTLDNLNEERRELTATFTEEAQAILMEVDDTKKIIIVSSPNWNSGINGLIASRLVNQYARPVIVLAEREEDMVASCRSIPEFNVVSALREVEEYLEHYGGHPGAAGFSIKKSNYKTFKTNMELIAERELLGVELKTNIEIECDISPIEINWETLQGMDELEPFGLGNPQPIFLLEQVILDTIKQVGKTGDHLSFTLGANRGIGFQLGRYYEQIKGHPVDMVCVVEESEWNGKNYIQIRALDIAVPAMVTK